MDRRKFLQGLAGAAAVGAVGAGGGLAAVRQGSVHGAGNAPVDQKIYRAKTGPTLFPTDVSGKQWARFRAAGFSQPACGIIYRRDDVVPNGMPLGGVATGCIDLQTDGTFGYCTLFNSGVPTRGPLQTGYLGVSVAGGPCWVLTTPSTAAAALPVVSQPSDIAYWGHYPIADLEYDMPGAPVSVGLRAWTPFIPGDVDASNIPAAIFEVHVRNLSRKQQKATIGFSFPGPTQAEAQISPTSLREPQYVGWPTVNRPVMNGLVAAERKPISSQGFSGLHLRSPAGTGYALGVIGAEPVRFGGPLWIDGYEYATAIQMQAIANSLPLTAEYEMGASLAVDVNLQPGEEKIVRIVLVWYSPIWKGQGNNCYRRMYTRQFQDAAAVALAVAQRHEELLRRVLAWQQTIYTAEEVPEWLRESLVNILHLITKTGYWAVAQKPLGDWCKPQDGLFGMNECPRECPQIECIPCSFYGNVPVVYFFPELALSTLRGYKAYQFKNGAPTWVFGGCTAGAAQGYQATDGADMDTPSPGYQNTLNGPCYVDMLDRYWQRTGSDAVLREFYPSIKKAVLYTLQLRPGPEGIISVPAGDRNPTQPNSSPGGGLDWFEGNGWFGMTPHVGGIHLAMLRMANRMAEHIQDKVFSRQCAAWIREGSELLESKLWAGKYYLAYYEPETNKKSDWVFAYQLDGQWMTEYHGLPGVFAKSRVPVVLDTIKHTCMAIDRYGAANFAQADGKPVAGPVGYGTYGYFPPEVFMLAATYAYNGQQELAMRLAKRCLDGICVQWGYTWTQPNVVNGQTGQRVYGADYYQNMMLWALPAALAGNDIRRATAPGSLVQRVIDAGRPSGV